MKWLIRLLMKTDWWPLRFARLFRLYFDTLDIQVLSADNVWTRPKDYSPGSPTIYCHCEGDFLALIGLALVLRFTTLVALGEEGDWASQLASSSGTRVVRGSSLRRGARALRELIQDLDSHSFPGGVCVDGPLGPPGIAKPGVLLCALHTRRSLIPLGVASRRKIVFTGTWSKMFLPLPFSRVVICTGTPLWVEGNPSRRELEELSQTLTRRLGRERRRAQNALNSGAQLSQESSAERAGVRTES